MFFKIFGSGYRSWSRYWYGYCFFLCSFRRYEKGGTYTQVAQYCVLIFAYLVPAIFISILITNNPIPQLGFGGQVSGSSVYLLDKLDQLNIELGFNEYTSNTKSNIDVFFITAALMFGTAGLPHVIVRFFTVLE